MDFKKDLVKALAKAGVEETLAEQLLEAPSKREMGDFALPCFKLAAEMKKNPVLIAQEISAKIVLPKGFRKAEAKGPYINFFVEEGKQAKETIGEILAKKEKYGIGKPAKGGDRIIVEYCQANPMKAFHIGHVRNIVLGEAIARLFEASGKKVFRANYGGDVGPHVSKTLYAYRELAHETEPKGIAEKGAWLGKLYKAGADAVKEDEANNGANGLEQKMRDMVVELESGKNKSLVADWKKLRKMSLEYFSSIYAELGIKFDRIILESEVEKEGIAIAHKLLEQGFAIRDQGALLVNLEEHGLGKFLVLKSDGAALYSSKDLALAKLKKKEIRARISYNLVGSEQAHYFRQLMKTIELLNQGNGDYCKTVHLSYEMVRLEGGKMSSREGNVIAYSELLDAVFSKTFTETMSRHPDWPKEKIEGTAKALAMGAIKFGMLCQDRNSVITFNWEKATSLDGETAPFILYSHCRANSILKKAGKLAKQKPKEIMPETEKEKSLISMLAAFPEKAMEAAEQESPHKVSFYLIALAQEFNSFYHEVPVLQAGPEKAVQRIAIVRAVAQVLENGLRLLNINTVEEM
ncbi:Arginine--tRNA ligase [uncultured archaeon]|nr:Arginine--tRNA ligase [uncultured archaeon]